jgi:hypothetical protein
MPKNHRRDRGVKGRIRALVAVFHLAVFAAVAPMLVLCNDGDRHATVESAFSLCCAPNTDEGGPIRAAVENWDVANNGCAGSCTDTPLMLSLDAATALRIARACDAVAVAAVLPFALAFNPAPARASQEPGARSVFSPSDSGRSAVLRI